jgi:hypothetical protein
MTRSAAPAFAALLAGLCLAAPVRAAVQAEAEHRLTAAEIRDIARADKLWCDGYDAATGDCEQVTLIQILPDGRLTQTTALTLAEEPLLQAYFGEVDGFNGDRICNLIDTNEMPMGFTLEGAPVPEPEASKLRSALLETLADLAGKRVCQSFFRGADPNRIREEITVDGKRRTDLESVYQLRDGAEGFALRAPRSDDKDSGVRI